MAGEVANDGSAFWPRQQTHNMQNIFCSFFAFTKNFLESPPKCGKRMKYEKMILLLTYFCLEVVYIPREEEQISKCILESIHGSIFASHEVH